MAIAPANVHETTVAEDMLADFSGWVLADRNYWNPELKDRLTEHELILFTAFRKVKYEQKAWPIWLRHKRYRIKTLVGQPNERSQVKRD